MGSLPKTYNDPLKLHTFTKIHLLTLSLQDVLVTMYLLFKTIQLKEKENQLIKY